MAKMCVRELRTEAPNTSVFYMAAVSLVAALVGCFLPMAWGDTTSFKVPDRWFQWLLLVGIGEHSGSPLFIPFCYMPFSRNRVQRKEEKPSKACWMHIAQPSQHNDQMVPTRMLLIPPKTICSRVSSRAGLTSYGSQFCMTCALRYARAAPALAMSYISVVLTIIYGYFIFHEVRAWPIFSLCILGQVCGTHFPTKLPIACNTGQHAVSWGICELRISRPFTWHQEYWKHPVRHSM